jgi:hypothetical protein
MKGTLRRVLRHQLPEGPGLPEEQSPALLGFVMGPKEPSEGGYGPW